MGDLQPMLGSGTKGNARLAVTAQLEWIKATAEMNLTPCHKQLNTNEDQAASAKSMQENGGRLWMFTDEEAERAQGPGREA